MNDYRTRISSSPEFDDDRHWRFARTSGLPRGYFDRPRLSADAIVVIVCAVIGTVMLGVLIAERVWS